MKTFKVFSSIKTGRIIKSFFLLTILIVGVCNYSISQTTLASATAIGSSSTTSTTFATVTGASVVVNATAGDKVLVVASFQAQMTAPGTVTREASFRLADNAYPTTINSGIIRRGLSGEKITDYGIGSLVYIFNASATGNNTYVLQHAFSSPSTSLTTDATIVAIVLKGGTEQLKCDVKTVSSPVTMGTSWATVTGTETTPISSTGGGFYVAASIGSLTTSFSTSSVAEWKLQYKLGSGGTWTDMLPAVQRSMSNTSDRGIISLVGTLPDWSAAGDYYFQIVHRRTSAASVINTESAKIVAVSLGITDGQFPVFFKTADAIPTSSATLGAAATSTMTPSANTSVFIHAQYAMSATVTSNATYDLFVDGGAFDGSEQIRYISGSSDYGAGASVGLSSTLSSSTTYNVSLRHAISTGTLTSDGISLNGFGLTMNSGPMPVELLYFNAENSANSEVVLNWATASETNNDYFIVERSNDALSWEELQRVNGTGNSNTKQNYSLIDTKPYSGNSYYRLTQTDFNGETKELETIAVTLNNNSSNLNLFPNPFNDKLIIQYDGNENYAEIEIYNLNGQVVFKDIIQKTTVVPTNSFSQGIYFVKVNNGNSLKYKKFIKE